MSSRAKRKSERLVEEEIYTQSKGTLTSSKKSKKGKEKKIVEKVQEESIYQFQPDKYDFQVKTDCPDIGDYISYFSYIERSFLDFFDALYQYENISYITLLYLQVGNEYTKYIDFYDVIVKKLNSDIKSYVTQFQTDLYSISFENRRADTYIERYKIFEGLVTSLIDSYQTNLSYFENIFKEILNNISSKTKINTAINELTTINQLKNCFKKLKDDLNNFNIGRLKSDETVYKNEVTTKIILLIDGIVNNFISDVTEISTQIQNNKKTLDLYFTSTEQINPTLIRKFLYKVLAFKLDSYHDFTGSRVGSELKKVDIIKGLGWEKVFDLIKDKTKIKVPDKMENNLFYWIIKHDYSYYRSEKDSIIPSIYVSTSIENFSDDIVEFRDTVINISVDAGETRIENFKNLLLFQNYVKDNISSDNICKLNLDKKRTELISDVPEDELEQEEEVDDDTIEYNDDIKMSLTLEKLIKKEGINFKIIFPQIFDANATTGSSVKFKGSTLTENIDDKTSEINFNIISSKCYMKYINTLQSFTYEIKQNPKLQNVPHNTNIVEFISEDKVYGDKFPIKKIIVLKDKLVIKQGIIKNLRYEIEGKELYENLFPSITKGSTKNKFFYSEKNKTLICNGTGPGVTELTKLYYHFKKEKKEDDISILNNIFLIKRAGDYSQIYYCGLENDMDDYVIKPKYIFSSNDRMSATFCYIDKVSFIGPFKDAGIFINFQKGLVLKGTYIQHKDYFPFFAKTTSPDISEYLRFILTIDRKSFNWYDSIFIKEYNNYINVITDEDIKKVYLNMFFKLDTIHDFIGSRVDKNVLPAGEVLKILFNDSNMSIPSNLENNLFYWLIIRQQNPIPGYNMILHKNTTNKPEIVFSSSIENFSDCISKIPSILSIDASEVRIDNFKNILVYEDLKSHRQDLNNVTKEIEGKLTNYLKSKDIGEFIINNIKTTEDTFNILNKILQDKVYNYDTIFDEPFDVSKIKYENTMDEDTTEEKIINDIVEEFSIHKNNYLISLQTLYQILNFIQLNQENAYYYLYSTLKLLINNINISIYINTITNLYQEKNIDDLNKIFIQFKTAVFDRKSRLNLLYEEQEKSKTYDDFIDEIVKNYSLSYEDKFHEVFNIIAEEKLTDRKSTNINYKIILPQLFDANATTGKRILIRDFTVANQIDYDGFFCDVRTKTEKKNVLDNSFYNDERVKNYMLTLNKIFSEFYNDIKSFPKCGENPSDLNIVKDKILKFKTKATELSEENNNIFLGFGILGNKLNGIDKIDFDNKPNQYIDYKTIINTLQDFIKAYNELESVNLEKLRKDVNKINDIFSKFIKSNIYNNIDKPEEHSLCNHEILDDKVSIYLSEYKFTKTQDIYAIYDVVNVYIKKLNYPIKRINIFNLNIIKTDEERFKNLSKILRKETSRLKDTASDINNHVLRQYLKSYVINKYEIGNPQNKNIDVLQDQYFPNIGSSNEKPFFYMANESTLYCTVGPGVKDLVHIYSSLQLKPFLYQPSYILPNIFTIKRAGDYLQIKYCQTNNSIFVSNDRMSGSFAYVENCNFIGPFKDAGVFIKNNSVYDSCKNCDITTKVKPYSCDDDVPITTNTPESGGEANMFSIITNMFNRIFK
jgi:hypothetical protein